MAPPRGRIGRARASFRRHFEFRIAFIPDGRHEPPAKHDEGSEGTRTETNRIDTDTKDHIILLLLGREVLINAVRPEYLAAALAVE